VGKTSTIGRNMGDFIGMDLSDRQATVVVIDYEGRVVEEDSVPVTPALGTKASNWQVQEESNYRRGPQARRPPAPPLGDRRSLRATASVR
jgi:hypothetical protein